MPDANPADAATAAATPPAETAPTPATGDTSTTTAPAAPVAPETTAPAATATADPELLERLRTLEADAEKWRNLSRKNEDKAKANAAAAKELEDLRRSTMSEQERIVNDARAEARAEVIREFGGRLARAEFRAAAAGRIDDAQLSTLLEAIDLSKFIDENGEPKAADVAKFIDSIVPKVEAPPEPKADDPTQPATPAAPAATDPGPLPPLVQPGDTGQGAGRSGAVPLNGDPIERMLSRMVGR